MVYPMARGSRVEATAVKSVRLAMMYKQILDVMLVDTVFTHGLVVEDDLLLASDFVEYFTVMAEWEAREAEKSRALKGNRKVFCVSAFNDNGFPVAAQDETQVHRAEV